LPRFFFNQISGETRIKDLEGADFASLQAVWAEAVASAREIVSDEIMAGKGWCTSTFEVTDQFGRVVLVVPFDEALNPDRPLFIEPAAA
jgi:hypothetical protein